MKSQAVIGMTVNIPTSRGIPMRLSRCRHRRRNPRDSHSKPEKNPLRRKNKGMRKPWITAMRYP